MEKRHSQRHRTFKGAKIVFNHDRSVVDCTVKNLSGSGAALTLETTIDIPDGFNLIISPDNVSKACKVIWKTAIQIGVAFMGI